MMTRRPACVAALSLTALALGCGENHPAGPSSHVIEIDIDDHGLAGLWMATAPNIKGLIARGTLAFTRVVVPTHSNQNNMSLLTGQYPDGDDVPANDWLSRSQGFVSPVSVAGALSAGDYALWDKNPLRVRGDSLYGATRVAGGRSAYVGELPPFEAGADDVHLSILGTMFESSSLTLTVDETTAKNILTNALGYPQSIANSYNYDGPPESGETQTQFTLRDAADYIRNHAMPATMFVWDFVALDDDPTSMYGADGPQIAQIIEDYDGGLGELLDALDAKGLTASTNILFTLDHGKVDTHNQVVLGTQGGASADGQMAALVSAQGAAMGLDTSSYALLNEDGDAQIYAVVPGAGTADGAAMQADVTHELLALIQSGAIIGLDTRRTLTADGALGTRSFHDFRAASPNQADIVVFPQDDWTLNQVDATNTTPGPFQEHTQYPYGRHGGFSADELYVPLIMAGPAFKSGVMLPHPVVHPEVAPTALATLGSNVALETAARGPIHAALVGDPGETIAVPADPTTARDLVLTGSGFEGTPPAPAATATNVIVLDVAGLYDDELFVDATTATAAAGFRALAAQGTRFEDCWTESRDWPVTEYQLLAGGYPVAPFITAAEDDPTVTFPPGQGLLQMPPATNRIADSAAYAAWRSPSLFTGAALFDAAAARGMTTALVGETDFQTLHVNAPAMAIPAAAPGGLGAQLGALAAAQPAGLLALVSITGAPRTANRHSAQAQKELQALAAAAQDAAEGVPGALVIITSRGATTIDDPGSDFYGPGSSRHIPLVLLGPGVRAGVVTGEPATPADLPATILYALGAPMTTDVAEGTRAAGTPVGGVPQPTPAAATQGHALLRAFLD
ncbi:MAG TPA: alkaline phosphatase family protein [Polyangia bacterium]|nr:alkaline phosphatase family protein [Polyangia bacterium]